MVRGLHVQAARWILCLPADIGYGRGVCTPPAPGESTVTGHCRTYLAEFADIIDAVDPEPIEFVAAALADARDRRGRVFVVGVGGSAATASHFAADLRRLARLEAHVPAENPAAFTARANDDGWEQAYLSCLEELSPTANDVVVAISVGGGDVSRGISVGLVRAFEAAGRFGCTRIALVGCRGGELARIADVAAIAPSVQGNHGTFHTETLHLAICHAVVSHPLVQARKSLWEERASV